MKLRLKEDPKEWRNFALIGAGFLAVVAFLLYRRRVFGGAGLALMESAAVFVALLAIIFPRRFRPVYRAAMTFSFYVGQVVQPILLTVVYFVLVTPLALALRLAGKDLLDLRKKEQESYWKSARELGSLEQQF